MASQLLFHHQMDTRKLALGATLISIATFFCVFYTVRLVFLALATGIGIGVLMVPVVEWLRKKAHLPAGVTAFLLLLLLIAILAGVGYSLYIIISSQLGKVIAAVPQAYSTVRDWLFHHSAVKIGGAGNINIPSALQSTLGTLLHGAEIGVKIGAGIFYVISVALYVAVDPARNENAFLTLFPAHLRPRVNALMTQSATTLRQWFMSHLIVVVCIGIAYALGLWLIGNPYWALFGVLAAVLEFVPYIGPFTVTIGASAVFLTNDQPVRVLWVLLMSLVLQEVEGHLLLPLVMKERISLPPVHLITMAIIMGMWFGILGVFATPPLLAVLRNVYLGTYAKQMEEVAYRKAG
jgi:predicted PurR-regulated permease PerM